MYDFLKALFGTTPDGKPEALTFDQLSEKLSASKDIKLANLSDGGYVSKEKHDAIVGAKETELNGVRQQLTDANAAIQSYKSMDIDGIKQSAAEWEQKYQTDTAALTKRLADQERTHQEDLFFAGYKFSSKAAAAGVRSEFSKRTSPSRTASLPVPRSGWTVWLRMPTTAPPLHLPNRLLVVTRRNRASLTPIPSRLCIRVKSVSQP